MDTVFEFILHSRYKVIKSLVAWMQYHLRKGECVNIYQWIDSRWYIEVTDEPMKAILVGFEKARAMRFGFTVDISKDTILWNCQGGNCWVRDRHWHKLFVVKFSKQAADNELLLGRFPARHKHIQIYKFSPRKLHTLTCSH